MINYKNKGLFIVISGPSGVGKGTICRKLIKDNNAWLSVSATTRDKRSGEVDGIDYHFLSKNQFEELIEQEEFIEYATVYNNYYGTKKQDIYKYIDKGIDVILEIDINGALQIQEKIKEAVFIFIMPPSMKELKKRLLDRNTESKEKQFERFQKSYTEINSFSKYNYVVVNNNIGESVKKVTAIIESEKCRVDRIEEIFLDSVEEKIHEELIAKNINN